MRTKSIFTLFIVLFLLIIPYSLFAQQSDFYGTWVAKITEDGETVLITFTISAANMIMSVKLSSGNETMDLEDVHVSILSWTSITNSDSATRVNFPNGYEINTSLDGVEEPIEIFISRDKRQLTAPDLNDSLGRVFFFIKQ